MRIDQIIALKTILSQTGLRAGVVNEVTTVIDMSCPQQESPDERTYSLNLAVVLDISGSMKGTKLENCKTAIEDLLQTVIQKGDTFHIVVYATNARVVVDDAGFGDLEDAIARLRVVDTEDNTNIEAGLKLAFAQLRKVPDSEDECEGEVTLKETPRAEKTVVKRVMFFSDGNANRGIRSTDALTHLVASEKESQNLQLTSFGVGSKYNDALMRALADAGSAPFYYIETDDAIPVIVKNACDCVNSLLSVDNAIRVFGIRGAVVTKVWGFPEYRDTIDLSDFVVGSSKKIVVTLTVPVGGLNYGEFSALANQDFLGYSVTVHPTAMRGQEVQVLRKVSLPVCGPTDNVDLPEGDEDAKVLQVALAVARFGEEHARMQKLLERRRYRDAVALGEESVRGLEESVASEELPDHHVAMKLLTQGRHTLGEARKGRDATSTRGCSYSSGSSRTQDTSYVSVSTGGRC